MLAALPVELVQLVALCLPLPSIAKLARVSRFVAACIAEPSFWGEVAAMHGVPADQVAVAAAAGARALHALIDSSLCAVPFASGDGDSSVGGQRVTDRSFFEVSANHHAVVCKWDGFVTIMSERVLTCAPGAPPRVLCYRVLRPRGPEYMFSVGVSSVARLIDAELALVDCPPDRVCAVGHLRAQLQLDWSARASAPANAFAYAAPSSVLSRGDTFVAMIVARSSAQPSMAVIVTLVLSRDTADAARARVMACFRRRMLVVDGDGDGDGDAGAYSVVVELLGRGMACMCVVPPRELEKRAPELLARADAESLLAPAFLDDMHDETVDMPGLCSSDDNDFVAFARGVERARA